MKITIEKVFNGYIVNQDYGDKESKQTHVISESEWIEDDGVRAVRDLLFMVVDMVDPNIRVDIKIKMGKHSEWAKLD